MHEDRYYITIDTLASENGIISQSLKTKVLNKHVATLLDIKSKIRDIDVKISIDTLLLIIEDAYKIDMYKFQFTLLSDMIEKETKTFEEILTFQT